MFKKLLLLLAFCMMFSVFTAFGQKPREEESPRIETREESKPVESPAKVEESKPAESPREESKPVESPSTSNNNDSSSSRSNDDSRSEKSSKRDNDSGSSERNSRSKGKEDNDNSNTPPSSDNEKRRDNRDRNDRKDRDRDKDRDGKYKDGRDKDRHGKKDDDDKDGKHRRNRKDRDNDVYQPVETTDDSSNNTTPSVNVYFDKDDVFFDAYNSYLDTVPNNYLPYFENPMSYGFQPLFYIYVREFGNNEFPFVAKDWVIYYEPYLDDVYVNFSKFSPAKYEKMIWLPLGKTAKKVAKKFNYKGPEARPTIVEKIPEILPDKVYSFNVHELPKGQYEIRFIAKDGSTVKQVITLK